MARAFDFAKEIEALQASNVRAGDLALWGGVLKATATETLEQVLARFVAHWDTDRQPYRIWEYAHRITFTERAVNDYGLLERGRIFGAGGDLALRRDNDAFRWHFIGSPSTTPPDGFSYRNFWDSHPDTVFRHHEKESALLWGLYHQDHQRWLEDRVGWADLRYPTDATALPQDVRMQIVYDSYTDGGQTAFVWWQEIMRYA